VDQTLVKNEFGRKIKLTRGQIFKTDSKTAETYLTVYKRHFALADSAEKNGVSPTELIALENRVQELESENQALKEAALASRDLMDFMRAGYISRELNRIIPFFNSSIQGTDKFFRELKNNPVNLVTKATMAITIPSIILHALANDDEEIERVDRYTKDMYWIVRAGDTLIKIPKPYEAGLLFGSLAERSLDYFKKDDPLAYKGFVERVVNSFLPEVLPQIYKVPIELGSNYSFFFDNNIVPQYEQYLPKKQQFGANTSESAKLVGSLLNMSPRKIDYAVQGTTGTAGKSALSLLDSVLDTAGVVDKKSEPMKNSLSSIPGLSGLVVSPYVSSKFVSDFYDDNKKLSQQKESYDFNGEKIPDEIDKKLKLSNTYKSMLSKANKKIATTKESDLTPEQKKTEILKLQKLQDDLVKQYFNGVIVTSAKRKEYEDILK
jgi:hypothetical protein